jgi:hypothetical protein
VSRSVPTAGRRTAPRPVRALHLPSRGCTFASRISAATVNDERAPVRFSEYGDASGCQRPVELLRHQARVPHVLERPVSPYAVDALRSQGEQVGITRDESNARGRAIGRCCENPLIEVESDNEATGSDRSGES